MKISTKGRYALRLMLDIAANEGEKPIRIKDIATRQNISDKYLEQIVAVLNKGGMVRSIRGPQGGYTLKEKPEECTVGMIIRLTEGSLAPVECVEEDAISCERQSDCITYFLWKKIDEAIKGVVDTVTLKDLLDWKRQQ